VNIGSFVYICDEIFANLAKNIFSDADSLIYLHDLRAKQRSVLSPNWKKEHSNTKKNFIICSKKEHYHNNVKTSVYILIKDNNISFIVIRKLMNLINFIQK